MNDSVKDSKSEADVVDRAPLQVNELLFVQTVKNLMNSPAKEKKRTPPKRGQVG